MSLCPLCNQRIEGDEAFVNYHVNKCIESGSGGQAEASSSSNSRDKGRSGVEEEEKGRKELLRQQEEADAEVARALMMTEQAVVQSGGTILSVGGSMEVDDDDEEEGEGDEGPQCPICFLPWSQLGVELGNEMGMATHAQICLEGGSGEGYQDEDDEDEDDEGEEEDELFAGIIGSGVGKSRIGFGNAANSRAIIGIPGMNLLSSLDMLLKEGLNNELGARHHSDSQNASQSVPQGRQDQCRLALFVFYRVCCY